MGLDRLPPPVGGHCTADDRLGTPALTRATRGAGDPLLPLESDYQQDPAAFEPPVSLTATFRCELDVAG
jgi:hypothetical protein